MPKNPQLIRRLIQGLRESVGNKVYLRDLETQLEKLQPDLPQELISSLEHLARDLHFHGHEFARAKREARSGPWRP